MHTGRLIACSALLAGCSIASEGEQDSSHFRTITLGPESGDDVVISEAPGHQVSVDAAVDPTDPSRYVVVANAPFSAFNFFDTFVTTDGGLTWTRVSIGGAVDGLPSAADRRQPSVAFDDAGRLYLSYTVRSSALDVVAVIRSDDGGATYDSVATLSAQSPENPQLAVGPGPLGVGQRVYVAWSEFGDGDIRIAGSANAGVSFSSPVLVNAAAGVDEFPSPAVDDEGTVYVVWNRGATSQLVFDRSTDGGLTFGADQVIASTGAGSQSLISAMAQGTFATPEMAIDRSGGPFDGRLYVVSLQDLAASPTAGPSRSAGDLDVVLRYSDDGGATWSGPVPVRPMPQGSHQFLPEVAVDPVSGHVVVTWYDTTTALSNPEASLFSATSVDGGASFLPPQMVSDEPSNQSATSVGFTFDTGLAVLDCRGLAAWQDNRDDPGDLDIYADAVDVACEEDEPPKPCLHGQQRVELADRAQMFAAPQSVALVTSGGQTVVGADALAGAVDSVHTVELRDRATVLGDVQTGGTVILRQGSSVLGDVVTMETPVVPDATAFLVPFPATAGSIDVTGQGSTLAPGAYATLRLAPGANVKLQPGTYFFDHLILEPGSVVKLPAAAPTLHVRTSLVARGTFTGPQAFAGADVIFHGQLPVSLEAPFEGRFVAPFAEVVLASVSGVHEGSFYGGILVVRPAVAVVCRELDPG